MATKQQSSPTGTSPSQTTQPPKPVSPAAQAAIDALKAAPSGTGKALPQSSPIGVPYYATDPKTGELTDQRWQATRAGRTPRGIEEGMGLKYQYGVTPKYYEGDTQALMSSLPPEVLADLQAEMVAIGLYGSKKPNITFGIPDRDTMSAFQQVLSVANASGYDYQEVLQQWSKAAALAPQPTEPKPNRVADVTNEEDLVNVFKEAARTAIGREVSETQARAWAHTYQGAQVAEQQARWGVMDASVDGSPVGARGTVESTMTPQSFAESQLKGTPEYGATRASNQLDTFRKILSGPFGGGK